MDGIACGLDETPELGLTPAQGYVNMPNDIDWLLVLGQEDLPSTSSPPSGESGTQAPGGTSPGPGPGRAAPTPFSWLIWLPILLLIIFMFWSSTSAQRKERKKREAMLASLKKHSRVQTIGGVIGSVVEVKDQEVILKVDESNNIKMRFARSAIQQVLTEGDGSAKAMT